MDVIVNPNCVTTFESYFFEYEWKISNVNDRVSKPEALECPEKLKSPPGQVPATIWKLEALQHFTTPQNSYSSNQESYNVVLTLTACTCANPSDSVWAGIRIGTKVKNMRSFQNPPPYFINYLTISPPHYLPNTIQISAGNRFTGYIPRKDFSQYTDGGDLIIHCCIFVKRLEHPIHVINSPAVEVKEPTFNLSTVMEDARHNDQYTDVTLVTEERKFRAHKVVLATQSSFFATRFEERWSKNGSSEIDMLDVPAETMGVILTYMYTGRVVDIDKTAHDLLPKAEEYHLEGLKTMCEEALSKSLTAQTAIDILLLANTHNAQNLKKSCLAFVAKNITDVKKSAAWVEERLKKGADKELWMEMLEYTVNSW